MEHASSLPFKDTLRLCFHLSLYFRPFSVQYEVWPQPHPMDTDVSITPVEGPWKDITTPPSTEPQTLAFVKIDLGSCYPLVLANRLLHSRYIQAAGYKDCDINGERRNPCRKRVSKRDTAQERIRSLIPKPTEQGLQSEDIEMRRQGAALPDRTLDSERPRTPSVHLHNCLRVVVHHVNPSAKLRFESGSLRNSRQKPMVNPIEGLGLI